MTGFTAILSFVNVTISLIAHNYMEALAWLCSTLGWGLVWVKEQQ